MSLTSRGWGGVPAPLTWVAVQNGDEPWRRLEGRAGRYDFEAPSGRYRLAFVCGLRTGEVIAATVAELAAITVSCTELPTGPKHTWSGAIKGTPAGRPVPPIGFFSRDGIFSGIVSGTRYTIELPAGIYDSAAMDVDQPLAPIFLRRNLEVSAAGTADVDFDGAGVIRPRPRAFTAPAGTPGEGLVATVLFRSGNGAWIRFLPGSSAAESRRSALPTCCRGTRRSCRSPATASTAAVTPERSWTAPKHSLPSACHRHSIRSSFILPPASSGGTWRPHARFAPYPDALFYQMSISGPTNGDLIWGLKVGAGWLAGNTGFELPDLTGVPGFDVTWGPDPRVHHAVITTVVTGTRGFGPTLNGDEPAAPGAVTTRARKDFGVGPPIAP